MEAFIAFPRRQAPLCDADADETYRRTLADDEEFIPHQSGFIPPPWSCGLRYRVEIEHHRGVNASTDVRHRDAVVGYIGGGGGGFPCISCTSGNTSRAEQKSAIDGRARATGERRGSVAYLRLHPLEAREVPGVGPAEFIRSRLAAVLSHAFDDLKFS